MSANLLPADSSYAALSAGGAALRAPKLPDRIRPAGFHSSFDALTLFYDCFWDWSGTRVLLVGPPPLNLAKALKTARFTALPSRTALKPRFHASLSTMITALAAPEGTTAIAISLADQHFELPVQPSSTAALAGSRLLFTINRDNDLAWIADWAAFHARVHGTDAVVLFDNGSSRYGTAEITETLRSINGLSHVAVHSWPHPFGPIDPAVTVNPYWPRFLQIGSMSVVLRRYGELAGGLLDCDIDELAGTHSGTSIYDLARASRGGLVAFRGIWIEAEPPGGTRHRDFTRRLADPELAASSNRKWALDPSRKWVRRLTVHPYWHWIEGRPFWAKSMPDDAFYLHYKGINTNWKQPRRAAPAGATVTEPTAMRLMESVSR